MYPQTLYSKTKQVLEKLKNSSVLEEFYLAEGTALALQLGHRKSIDLDFFSDIFPKRDILLQNLRHLHPTVSQENPGTLDLIIDDVKVSFLEYKYPLIEPLKNFLGIKIAGVSDIGCMKLSAISSRGSKKDFVDLFYILQNDSLSEHFSKFEIKFKGVDYQKIHLLKALVYFYGADKEPEPDYLESVDWEKVKSFLESEVSEYIKSFR